MATCLIWAFAALRQGSSSPAREHLSLSLNRHRFALPPMLACRGANGLDLHTDHPDVVVGDRTDTIDPVHDLSLTNKALFDFNALLTMYFRGVGLGVGSILFRSQLADLAGESSEVRCPYARV